MTDRQKNIEVILQFVTEHAKNNIPKLLDSYENSGEKSSFKVDVSINKGQLKVGSTGNYSEEPDVLEVELTDGGVVLLDYQDVTYIPPQQQDTRMELFSDTNA